MLRTVVLSVCTIVLLACIPQAEAGSGKGCQGWIAIESVPDDKAFVFLDGKDTGKQTPTTLKNVPCGKHLVGVSKLLYSGSTKKIVVSDQEVVKARLTLKPNFAPVDIISLPPGAAVSLDGKALGESPLKIARLEAGMHEIRASFPDYKDAVKKFKLKPGKNVTVKLELKPTFGGLVITSSPEDAANVFLDGDELGTTPLTLKRVVLGNHNIRVVKELYEPFKTSIQVRTGKLIRVTAKLKPVYGTLAVASKPAGAAVLVDGKERGHTPVALKLGAGEHALQVLGVEGSWGAVNRKVRVIQGKNGRLFVKLPIRTGSLMVDSVPFAAGIELDGKKRGKAPLSLSKVPVGVHVIVARVKGKEPLTGRIEVVEGKTSQAEINLNDPTKSVFRSGGAGKPIAKPVVKQIVKPVKQPVKKTVAKTTAKPVKKIEMKTEKKSSADAGAKEVVATAAQTPVVKKGRPMSTWRWLAWISTGTAGTAAITAAVLFGVGYSTQSDADDAWTQAQDTTLPAPRRDYFYQRSKDLDQKAAGLLTGGWVTAGLAAAAGGAAIFFFLTEPEPESGSARAEVQFGPLAGGGGWVGLQGRF
ncbi:MAG TPA: PEGA domain-containing protein [Myxococcota bacterium]|nr:PEGA domain-containing protein [Myxococcota bacterium]